MLTLNSSLQKRSRTFMEESLFRIYAEEGKVFAKTEYDLYQLRLRLYELEERLDDTLFVRISNSEIVNLKKVKNLDLSFV